MAQTDKPNRRFSWYMGQEEIYGGFKLGILVNRVTSGSTNREGNWDTYSDSSVTNGIRIHYHAYLPLVNSMDSVIDNFSSKVLTSGEGSRLPRALIPALIDYVKAGLAEDAGNAETAAVHLARYREKVSKHPHNKQGLRRLSVPRL